MEKMSQNTQKNEVFNSNQEMVSWYEKVSEILGFGFEHKYGLEESDLTIARCNFYEDTVDAILSSKEHNEINTADFEKIIKYMKLKNNIRGLIKGNDIEEKDV